jgi:hypothetical protein
VFDNVGVPGDGRGDHRQADGHRFEQGVRDAFRTGGQHERVCAIENRSDVVAIPEESHVRRHVQVSGERGQLVLQRAVADHVASDARLGSAFADPRHRPQQHVDPLLLMQASDEHHVGRPVERAIR